MPSRAVWGKELNESGPTGEREVCAFLCMCVCLGTQAGGMRLISHLHGSLRSLLLSLPFLSQVGKLRIGHFQSWPKCTQPLRDRAEIHIVSLKVCAL